MHKLIKALALLGMMILVSCGSGDEDMDCPILNLNFGDNCTINTDRGDLDGVVDEDCECLVDDERDDESDDERDNEREENEGEDCYSLLFPVSVMLPDGTTATADDDENLEAIYSDWFEANPDSAQEPEFIFPIEVTFEDSDRVHELNSSEELERLENLCEGDDEDDNDEGDERGDCFELVYPIGVNLPDGTAQRAADEEALEDIYEAWFDANPDSREEPSLIFPIQIILESVDRPVDIQSEAELERYYNRCDDGDDDDDDDDDEGHGDEDRFECFEIVFPIGVTLPDGTVLRAADEDALESIFERWVNANPDSEEEPTLIYPIQIVFEDIDRPVDINSSDELERAFNRCDSHDDRDDCFDIVYPVGVSLPDGTTVRAADEEALERIFERWFNANPTSDEEPTLLFPIQVIFDDNDRPIDVATEAELERIYERCEQSGGNDDFDCPELRADIGDPCRLDNGTAGTITRACTCE